MPSTYSHFALTTEVLPLLPDHLAKICKTYEKYFQIGSQGPDFFLFFRPRKTNKHIKTGRRIHNRTFEHLLERVMPLLKEYGTDSKEYAYMLGFVCHFTLDSNCHPYVIPMAEKLQFRHTAMETEFDRYLMELHGKDPYTYPSYEILPTEPDVVECIHHIFPKTSKKVIKECLSTYRFYRKLWRTPTKLKYNLVKLLFLPRRRREYFTNFLLPFEGRETAQITNPELHKRYNLAVKEAVVNMEAFHQAFLGKAPLPDGFKRNFKD